jgi:hypothetical protein
MTDRNPITEDMFEKAREVFFGTAKTSRQRGDTSAEFVDPRDEPARKEVTGPTSD